MKSMTKHSMNHRIVSVFLLVMIFASVMCVSASAANTGNTYFSSFKATVVGYNAMSDSDARSKTNSSCVYAYVTSGTYSSVRVRTLGSTSQTGSYTNRTYAGGTVSYVTCAVGVQYQIHNTINESGESWAKLSFHSPYSSPNYVTGAWSPDCGGTYTDAAQ